MKKHCHAALLLAVMVVLPMHQLEALNNYYDSIVENE
jgi:hypothetical protein